VATDTDDAARNKPVDSSAAATNDTPPVITSVQAPPTPTDSELSKVAEAHGEPIVSADDTKSAAGSAQAYTAQPGDSLSKIAAKFYGSGTKANRDLIAKANPSLQANENMIIAGKTYQIPGAVKSPARAKTVVAVADNATPTADATNTDAADTSTTVDDSTAKAASATQDKPAKAAADAGYLYTVQPGDNLTRIARNEVGDVHAIAAIQELNPDKLKGPNHDIVIAGCKLRLPGKPLARAE
jgi:Tfp pilus assembly protein FimV